MLPPTSLGRRLLQGSGLLSVSAAGRDAALIILTRSCRMFAYGASSLVLALFFAALGFPDARIGAFMTLTLLGDVALSLALSLIADRAGRRRTLLFGSALMVVSGAVFALCENFWVLLAAAVVGVISATGGDFGPFRAIEESMLAELTGPDTRADVLVWYVTLASLATAIGTEASGRIVEALRARDGWTLLSAYHGVFGLYVVAGVVNMACAAMLSARCELRWSGEGERGQGPETEPLLRGDAENGDGKEEPKSRRSWVARISPETLTVVGPLVFLLMLDSYSDGMTSFSLTTYFMDTKFRLSKSALGDIISASYLLASLSNIFAGPLARSIGLVRTMVFTHVPSSMAVLLFPLAPSVPLMVALLLVRLGLNNMDQGPRAALIAAVVRPAERTAVLGIISMLRTLASAAGPTMTGLLAGGDRFWIAFVVAGALRLVYDFGLFIMFLNVKLYKHEKQEESEAQQA
ncbi:90ef9373-af0d-4f62-be1f-537bbcb5bb7d [Thermothielavioides terrestris]|uniref:90ef9373-af0d-4f62-be1f-537bbcb5bb7d n=1 Tax=Thermothielavioides terrestris TaxID=2587410 RepID=A0A446BX46_9PEZI|nr:90ef9373-af0d-4f62-be1f-537bbcb5bb7d [Thermothielavioides terrestris]